MPNQLIIKTYPALLNQLQKVFIEGMQRIEESAISPLAKWRDLAKISKSKRDEILARRKSQINTLNYIVYE